MNVAKCYALTNGSIDDDKDQLYGRLQSITAKCSGNDLAILLGNLSTKIRMDSIEYEGIMGRYGVRERDENDERFKSLCAFN